MDIKVAIIENISDIDELCEYIDEHGSSNDSLNDRLEQVFEKIDLPCTAVCEYDYVDRIYRDTYYNYFSGKYYPFDRNCKRLSLFSGIIDIYDFSKKAEKNLQESFIGTIVIKPIDTGKIGRTILNPKKLNISKAYMRLTTFQVVIAGHKLVLEGFPFSSQDSETMTCAETTVWCILEYYGNQYGEYKTILPSDIYNEISRISDERVWPSKGLQYEKVSNLLKTFGFSPRLYALEAYGECNRYDFETNKEYRRIFHYYVESGIPFAVGIMAKDPKEIGHSMVCIGHAAKRKSIKKIDKNTIEDIPYIDSADYFEEYIMIDDNRMPYAIDKYLDMSFYGIDTLVDVFAVPLYKRILMEAVDAKTIIYELLQFEDYNFNYFLKENSSMDVSENNPVVVRIFLTSSRKYKSYRARKAKSREESVFYAKSIYPRFLWVAEISTHKEYKKGVVYGEIVLDATTPVTGADLGYGRSVILLRYFSHVGYSEEIDGMEEYTDEIGDKKAYFATRFDKLLDALEAKKAGFESSFSMYVNNLQEVGKGKLN